MFERLKRLDKLMSMTPEERRREPREEVTDGTAEILGKTYPLKNWSARGFCVATSEIDRKPGDRLDISFSVPLPDRGLDFACRVALMRIDQEKEELAGIFVNLDAGTQKIIDKHFQVFSVKSWRRAVFDRLEASVRGARPRG